MPHLSRRSLNLARRTLRSLLTRDASPRRISRALRLLRLLLALVRGLLVLGVFDGCLAGGGSGFGTLCADAL